jgi:hypothetical protein
MYTFTESGIPGIYKKYDNSNVIAGHIRLFPFYKFRGLCVYTYNKISEEYALHRVWSFGLVAIHHVGEGKYIAKPGWYFRFASISVKKIHHSITIRFDLADIYIPINKRY